MASNSLADFRNTQLMGVSILPGTTITTDTTTVGSAVDMQLSDGSTHALVLTGNCGDSSTSFYVKLTECATSGGSYTDISGALTATYTGTSAGDNLAVGISTNQRTMRYVKAACVTSGGGTPAVPIAVGIFAVKKISGSGAGNQVS